MPYYNGGNVYRLHQAYDESGQGVPSSLILRLLKQVVCALYFAYTSGVLHADLHDANILIHYNRTLGGRPDFYITDFEAAERGVLKNPMNRYTDDLSQLCFDLEKWLYCGPMVEYENRDVLWQYLDDVVHTVVLSIASTPVDHLPDLKPLIDVLQNAPAGPPETLPVGYGTEPENTNVPICHTTEQDALNQSVAGPWHLAQVRIERSTGRFRFMRVSLETYDDAASTHTWTGTAGNLVDDNQDTGL